MTSSIPVRCEHDLNAREVAVTADGYCPLCMDAEIDRLRTALEKVRASKMPGESRVIAIRALTQGQQS